MKIEHNAAPIFPPNLDVELISRCGAKRIEEKRGLEAALFRQTCQ